MCIDEFEVRCLTKLCCYVHVPTNVKSKPMPLSNTVLFQSQRAVFVRPQSKMENTASTAIISTNNCKMWRES